MQEMGIDKPFDKRNLSLKVGKAPWGRMREAWLSGKPSKTKQATENYMISSQNTYQLPYAHLQSVIHHKFSFMFLKESFLFLPGWAWPAPTRAPDLRLSNHIISYVTGLHLRVSKLRHCLNCRRQNTRYFTTCWHDFKLWWSVFQNEFACIFPEHPFPPFKIGFKRSLHYKCFAQRPQQNRLRRAAWI